MEMLIIIHKSSKKQKHEALIYNLCDVCFGLFGLLNHYKGYIQYTIVERMYLAFAVFIL